MRARNLIAALVIGTAIAAGLALALRNATETDTPLTATLLPAGNELPDFPAAVMFARAPLPVWSIGVPSETLTYPFGWSGRS